MSDLENIVVQVDRQIQVVSNVMAKLVELGYKETPVKLNSAYNAYFIYTDDGSIHWYSEDAPKDWVGKTVKVKDLLAE